MALHYRLFDFYAIDSGDEHTETNASSTTPRLMCSIPCVMRDSAARIICSYGNSHKSRVHSSHPCLVKTARKQEARSCLIRHSVVEIFCRRWGSGMLRLVLAEYCIDRILSGEQAGRVCRKLAAVIASQSSWQQHQLTSMAVINAKRSLANVTAA
jgi:hypothetical protein